MGYVLIPRLKLKRYFRNYPKNLSEMYLSLTGYTVFWGPRVDLGLSLQESLQQQQQEQEETLKQCREEHAAELKVPLKWWCSCLRTLGTPAGEQGLLMQWPELVLALQGKEEELQNVRDQLQQAQEERDGHVKTISNLKQVCGVSVVPDTGMAQACRMRWGREAGFCCRQLCQHLPSYAFSNHRR